MGCKRGTQKILKNKNLPDREVFKQYLMTERTQKEMCEYFKLKWCELRVLLDHYSNELMIYESREVRDGKSEVYYGLMKNDGIVGKYENSEHDNYSIPQEVMDSLPRGI